MKIGKVRARALPRGRWFVLDLIKLTENEITFINIFNLKVTAVKTGRGGVNRTRYRHTFKRPYKDKKGNVRHHRDYIIQVLELYESLNLGPCTCHSMHCQECIQ